MFYFCFSSKYFVYSIFRLKLLIVILNYIKILKNKNKNYKLIFEVFLGKYHKYIKIYKLTITIFWLEL